MSISGMEWLIILAVIVLVFGRTRVLQLIGDASPARTRPNPLLVVVAAVIGLCAGIAGFTLGSAPHDPAAIAPAELRTLDSSSGTSPALTRAGFAMAAVESSRRKLRGAPQRPPAQSLILTGRTMAEAPARLEIRLRPAPDLPPEAGQTNRPFPARGPPAWN